jgi:hypothetical protein
MRRVLTWLVVLITTGCALVEPPTVAMEPGEALVWTLAYENHSTDQLALHFLTSNPASPGGAIAVDPCTAAAMGPIRMVAPFSVHIGPGERRGVPNMNLDQVAALPVVIDSDELLAPVSPEGYVVVIGEDGDVDAVLPLSDAPGLEPRDLC